MGHNRCHAYLQAIAGKTIIPGSALTLAGLFALTAAAIFLVWPEALVGLYLDAGNVNAEALLAYAAPLLFVAAAFQVVDCLQAVASGILRGFKDTRTPMLIAVFSYWVVGLPAAYLLAFSAGLGGQGVWWGLAIGLSVAAILLTARVYRRERLGLLDGSGAITTA